MGYLFCLHLLVFNAVLMSILVKYDGGVKKPAKDPGQKITEIKA